jgi:hypothetical protein
MRKVYYDEGVRCTRGLSMVLLGVGASFFRNEITLDVGLSPEN